MMKDVGWGADLISPFETQFGLEDFALESIESNVFTQGPGQAPAVPWFNPASIVAEKGVFFVSLYVCRLSDDMSLAQRLAIWFGSLKETDHVKLSVASTVTGIPFSCLMTLLSAIANTRARVDIVLDQIVMDGLAYFYLLADKIIPCHAGGLFVPSFTEQRREDNSGSWRAVHDFYQWIVEDATARGTLTSEESAKLIDGLDIIVPLDRFSK